MLRQFLPVVLLGLLAGTAIAQKPPTREEKVRSDKEKAEAEGFWIYNDMPKAFAEAKATGKPILVVLRCIPCEECVKLDDELIDKNPAVRPLLDKFVRARIVGTNGLDLSLFQFDYDQSFATFLLNADGTVYGRFGTRSHRTNWVGDVSVAGLAKALQVGLDLHGEYPKNKVTLAAKHGPAPLFPSPEKFPSLSAKYTSKLNYAGNVVQSCIHCHQIGDAIRDTYRAKGQAIPEAILFPYPHPKSQGLILDPKECATVTSVEPGTTAAKAGFQAGDKIRTLAGQPLVSMADVQWVLNQTAPAGGLLKAEIERDGKPLTVTWTLPEGWRRTDDISWRVSAWSLRRMGTGGMVLESTDGALRVKSVGQFGLHATAKNAGFKPGDAIVSFDGKTDFQRESDLLAYSATNRKAGDKVPVVVLRDGKKLELTLPMQN